ncbi:carbonic anhydrase [Nocardia sp. NPDC024068]|uniref:carbonic anhydrase n=1 Tax=Nocardia sp. NPDC024068 TaxID=3157197 RepID=UPI0033C1E8FF
MPQSNPVSAWKTLREGNERFVKGTSQHPSQGAADRAKLVAGQSPTALLFGCSDSRVAAELIFDQGLGDMFVVRTAGHAIDASVLGSVEYGVAVLNIPLIVVLGHESCGAVKATLDTLDGGEVPDGFIRSIVEKVTPSILAGRREGLTEADEFTARHVVETSSRLMEQSAVVAQRVRAGECAIAGATYSLGEGRVRLRRVVGDIGEIA